MRVLCCYCGFLINEVNGEGVNGNSHGCCETCLPLVIAEIEAVTIEQKAQTRALVYLRKHLKETRENGLSIRFLE